MQDEEYPAYLKKQSYDDLLSISNSIDKEAQAKRYAMVLAEMAERDKRGAEPENKWYGLATLCASVLCILNSFVSLLFSRTNSKPLIGLAFGVVGLITVWFIRRNRGK